MDFQALLNQTPAKNFTIKEKRQGLHQLVAPLFHTDGDMVNIYLEQISDSRVRISDQGMSLMRLSYLFDVDTDKKRSLLNDIILTHGAENQSGNIVIDVNAEHLFERIMSFAHLVTEVESLEMLSQQTVAQMFYDDLRDYVDTLGIIADLKYNFKPRGVPDVIVDYAFTRTGVTRPIYLFGVKDSNKAQQTTIQCLLLTVKNIAHRSLVVCENIDNLSSFSRRSLINASGKIFDGLEAFQVDGKEYIERELAS